MTAGEPVSIHATCVLVGCRAVLLRGESGAGKSALAHALLARDDARLAVRLVSDDRTVLVAASGRLVAAPVRAIAGLVELRGVGLLRVPHAARALVGLVADLVPPEACERLPDTASAVARLLGVTVPRISLEARAPDAAGRILAALACIGYGTWPPPGCDLSAPVVPGLNLAGPQVQDARASGGRVPC